MRFLHAAKMDNYRKQNALFATRILTETEEIRQRCGSTCSPTTNKLLKIRKLNRSSVKVLKLPILYIVKPNLRMVSSCELKKYKNYF